MFITRKRLEDIKSHERWEHERRLNREREMSDMWQTDKPKKRGEYLITAEYLYGDKGRYVDIAYYGIMYGEKHECFYQVDSEWGDYKLEGVLAWMPLPEPWKGE